MIAVHLVMYMCKSDLENDRSVSGHVQCVKSDLENDCRVSGHVKCVKSDLENVRQ